MTGKKQRKKEVKEYEDFLEEVARRNARTPLPRIFVNKPIKKGAS